MSKLIFTHLTCRQWRLLLLLLLDSIAFLYLRFKLYYKIFKTENIMLWIRSQADRHSVFVGLAVRTKVTYINSGTAFVGLAVRTKVTYINNGTAFVGQAVRTKVTYINNGTERTENVVVNISAVLKQRISDTGLSFTTQLVSQSATITAKNMPFNDDFLTWSWVSQLPLWPPPHPPAPDLHIPWWDWLKSAISSPTTSHHITPLCNSANPTAV